MKKLSKEFLYHANLGAEQLTQDEFKKIYPCENYDTCENAFKTFMALYPEKCPIDEYESRL